MVMGAGQGDYPRIVLAARSIQEAYEATVRGFHLADKWQVPVIVLSDLLLSEHFETMEEFPMEQVQIDRGLIWDGKNGGGPFLRYQITPDGVSPRVIPGTQDGAYIAGSDEHDEDGTLVSDVRAGLPDAIEVRLAQMEKRMRKLDGAKADMKLPERIGPKSDP